MAAGGTCGLLDFFVACVKTPHADVFGDAVVKQVGILENDGDELHQFALGQAPDVRTAYPDAARLWVGVAHNQARQGGFAATRRTDQRSHGAGGNLKADSV